MILYKGRLVPEKSIFHAFEDGLGNLHIRLTSGGRERDEDIICRNTNASDLYKTIQEQRGLPTPEEYQKLKNELKDTEKLKDEIRVTEELYVKQIVSMRERITRFEEALDLRDKLNAELLEQISRMNQNAGDQSVNSHDTEVEETMKLMQEHMGWGSQNCPGLEETEDGCKGGSPEMIARFCSKCAYWEAFCESVKDVIHFDEIVCAGRRTEEGELYQRCQECIGLEEQI